MKCLISLSSKNDFIQTNPIPRTQKNERIIDLINKYIEICPEFFDVFEVLEFGISKYGGNGDNWLEPNASKMDHLSNCKSRNNHLQEDLEEKGHKDHESNLDVKLHEACRALMQHTREVRGIVHEKDKVSETE